MTTNQHPLTQPFPANVTDEMVEAGASYAWRAQNPSLPWDRLGNDRRAACRRDARNVLDAALPHLVTTPADVTDEMVEAARKYVAETKFPHLRGALSAALAVATPADPRRWRECRFDDIQKGERVRWALPEGKHGTFEIVEGVAHEKRMRKGDRQWVDAGGTVVACAPAHGTDGFRYWRLAGHEDTTPADPHHDPRPWEECTRKDIRKGDLVESRFVDILRIGVADRQDEHGDWCTEGGYLLTNGSRWTLRRIPATTEKETIMTETTPAAPSEPLARTLLGVPAGHGAPHHDGDRIRPDDFVLQVDESGFIRAGRAHYQDEDGRWYTQNGLCITWPVERADRPDAITVWPTTTPPAVEVELPTEHPAHITDVESVGGDVCAYMALDNAGDWCGVSTEGRFRYWSPQDLTAFTLPDGTRVRRDGERADGTPRFVKVWEEEK